MRRYPFALLLAFASWACSGNPPDEAFERTKQLVQQADEELHAAVRDLEVGATAGMACPKAQSLQEVVNRTHGVICSASQRYPDYAPFQAKCASTSEEVREAPQTVQGICGGGGGDDDF